MQALVRQELCLDNLSSTASHISLNASSSVAAIGGTSEEKINTPTHLYDINSPFTPVKLSYHGLPQSGRPGWSHSNPERLATTHGSSTIIWDLEVNSGRQEIVTTLRIDDNTVLDKDWNWIEPDVIAIVNRLGIHIWDVRVSSTKAVNFLQNPLLIRDVKSVVTNINRELLAWNRSSAFILASSTNNDDIAIWDTRSISSVSTSPLALLYGHNSPISCMDWNPSKRFELLSGDEKGVVKLWSASGSVSSSTPPSFRCISSTQATEGPIKRLQYAPTSERNAAIVVGETDQDIWLAKKTPSHGLHKVATKCNSLSLWDFSTSSCILSMKGNFSANENVYDATWCSNRNMSFQLVSISSPDNVNSLSRSLRFWRVSDELLRTLSPRTFDDLASPLSSGETSPPPSRVKAPMGNQWNLNVLKPDLLPLQSLFTNEVSSSYTDYDLLLEMPQVYELISSLNLQTFEIVTETTMCVSFKLYDAPKDQSNSNYLQCRVDIPTIGFGNPVWTLLSAQSTMPIPSGLKKKLDNMTSFYYPKKLPFLLHAIGILRESIGDSRDNDGRGGVVRTKEVETNKKSEEQTKVAMPCPRLWGASFSTGGQLVFFKNDIPKGYDFRLPKTYLELEELVKKITLEGAEEAEKVIVESHGASSDVRRRKSAVPADKSSHLLLNNRPYLLSQDIAASIANSSRLSGGQDSVMSDSRTSLSKSAPVNNFLENAMGTSLPSSFSRRSRLESDEVSDGSTHHSSYASDYLMSSNIGIGLGGPVSPGRRPYEASKQTFALSTTTPRNFVQQSSSFTGTSMISSAAPNLGSSYNRPPSGLGKPELFPKTKNAMDHVAGDESTSEGEGDDDEGVFLGEDEESGSGSDGVDHANEEEEEEEEGEEEEEEVNLERNSLFKVNEGITISPAMSYSKTFSKQSYNEKKVLHSKSIGNTTTSMSLSFREKSAFPAVGSLQHVHRRPLVGGATLGNPRLRSKSSKDLKMLNASASDVGREQNQFRRSVTIIPMNHELPSCRTLSLMYKYLPLKEECLDDEAAVTICHFNASIAKLMQRFELERIWTIVGGIMNPDLNMKVTDVTTKALWGKHPLGLRLIDKILTRYQMIGDVQMIATIACALSIPYRLAHITHLQKQKRKFHEEVVNVEEELLLVKFLKLAEWDGYRHSYANLLYSWGFYIQRCEVLKTLSSVHLNDRELLIYAECNDENSPPNGAPDSALTASTSTTSSSSSSSLKGSIASRMNSLERKQQPTLLLGSKDGDKKQSTTRHPHCAICETVVRGLSLFCLYCNHGGHLAHMTNWFASNIECPSGCGCLCRSKISDVSGLDDFLRAKDSVATTSATSSIGQARNLVKSLNTASTGSLGSMRGSSSIGSSSLLYGSM